MVQAGGIWLTVQIPAYPAWMLGALLQGIGTAMVYPTLLVAISDVAHPEAALTLISGLQVAIRMRETLASQRLRM